MTQFNWTISQLDTAPQDGNLNDVVKTVHYRYKGIDGDYQAETYGTYSCGEPSQSDFTAYPDLTSSRNLRNVFLWRTFSKRLYGLSRFNRGRCYRLVRGWFGC